MLLGEALSIVEAYEESRHDGWEQARFVAHAVYQIMSSKSLELSDICRFDWEGDKPTGPKAQRTEEWKEAFEQAKKIQSKRRQNGK